MTFTGDLIGLDIGGSTTRGVLFRDGRAVRHARGPSANVQNVSPDAAASALRGVFGELGAGPSVPVVAGAGGVDTPADAARLEALIRSVFRVPSEVPVTAVHDTRLILAAGGHTIGISVIAGTGSVAWGIDSTGRERRAGGWGYLLGDEGSGYWLGREAVRAVLRAHQCEPDAPASTFARAIVKQSRVREPVELIAAFHDRPERSFWAGLSRTVVEYAASGDATALDLTQRAAKELHSLVITVAGHIRGPLPVVLGGGLARTAVGEGLKKLLADSDVLDVTVLSQEPVLGAPMLARAVWG
ncbi:N-acetylglucosamine kinase [Kocuria sp. cx-116]|uniref:N-acetylglucosamine kinase n=1 Tax=Kocuria sp. cx-116 TaxID=2771378 RepID=UPI002A4E258A|nr:BadF/BadG/BcrA/BcrD ATPase family protein [Kocuria sp. cx-116]